MSVRKGKKQKKQAPQKCGATERLTVAVTRPEDEEDYSEMEKNRCRRSWLCPTEALEWSLYHC